MGYNLKLRAHALGVRNNEIKSLPPNAPKIYERIEASIRSGSIDLSTQSRSLATLLAEFREQKDFRSYGRSKADYDRTVRWLEEMSRMNQWRLVITGGQLARNSKSRRVDRFAYAVFTFGFGHPLPPPAKEDPEVICDYLVGDVTR
ncbi:MAG: hypothetical protein SFZ24_00815 [Planctomycetota bacterium]|nr:hypothetical protein [Planctomycetota bacterium]